MIPAKHEKVGIVSTVAVVDPSQCALVLVVQVVDGQYVTEAKELRRKHPDELAPHEGGDPR